LSAVQWHEGQPPLFEVGSDVQQAQDADPDTLTDQRAHHPHIVTGDNLAVVDPMTGIERLKK
jgi:hypothetical protein